VAASGRALAYFDEVHWLLRNKPCALIRMWFVASGISSAWLDGSVSATGSAGRHCSGTSFSLFCDALDMDMQRMAT
jgi:hypothetical protein